MVTKEVTGNDSTCLSTCQCHLFLFVSRLNVLPAKCFSFLKHACDGTSKSSQNNKIKSNKKYLKLLLVVLVITLAFC